MNPSAPDTPFITNQEIARVLFQMAALLETIEANPYRQRAYRRAALGVLFLPRPLASYYGADEVAPLPGLGERMRSHLAELINTGRLDTHETLLEEIGEPMLSLLSIQGIGPRTAIRLVRDLHVGSLEDLARAAREHRIRKLSGFGERREAQIAQAVESVLHAA